MKLETVQIKNIAIGQYITHEGNRYTRGTYWNGTMHTANRGDFESCEACRGIPLIGPNSVLSVTPETEAVVGEDTKFLPWYEMPIEKTVAILKQSVAIANEKAENAQKKADNAYAVSKNAKDYAFETDQKFSETSTFVDSSLRSIRDLIRDLQSEITKIHCSLEKKADKVVPVSNVSKVAKVAKKKTVKRRKR